MCVPTKMGALMPRKRFPRLLLSVTIPKCLTGSSSALLGELVLIPFSRVSRLHFQTCWNVRFCLSFRGWGARCPPSRDYPSSPPGSKWSIPATSGTRAPSWPWGHSLPQMPAVRSRGAKILSSGTGKSWFRMGAGAASASIGKGTTPGINGVHFHSFPTHTPGFFCHIHVQGCWRGEDDEAGAAAKEQPLSHR